MFLSGLLNFILFQIGWLACVLGAAYGYPGIGPVVVTILLIHHLRRSPQPRSEARLIGVVGVVGTAVDSLNAYTGILQFPVGQIVPWLCPLWITALWMILATTLRSSMAWLEGRYPLAAMLGAVAGPLSYYAGAELGAAALHPMIPVSLLVLAIIWGVVLPGLFWLSTSFPYTRKRGT